MMARAGGEVANEVDGTNTLSLVGGASGDALGAIAGDQNGAVALGGGHAVAKNGRPFDFNGRAPFTLELWARQSNGGGEFQHLVTNVDGIEGPTTGRNGWALYIYGPAPLRFAFEWDVPGNQYSAFTAAAPIGGWTYYAAVFDGQLVTLYVDGVYSGGGPIGAGALSVRAASLLIGASTPGSNTFSGSIDEVAIYPRALDGPTISRHYQVGVGN